MRPRGSAKQATCFNSWPLRYLVKTFKFEKNLSGVRTLLNQVVQTVDYISYIIQFEPLVLEHTYHVPIYLLNMLAVSANDAQRFLNITHRY